MKTLAKRTRADLGLLALPLTAIALLTYLSFLVSLVLLSASAQALRSGSYSSSPPSDVYLLKTALLANDREQYLRDEMVQLLADYLMKNPKVQLHVPLALATSNSSQKYMFAQPAREGVIIFSSSDLADSEGEVLLQVSTEGTLALAGNLEGQIPELTNQRLGKLPIEGRAESARLTIRGAHGWVKDYSSSGILLASPELMQHLAFPIAPELFQEGLICLCSSEEAKVAATSLTEYMQAGGFQMLALAQDPVTALPATAQVEAASELLLGIYPVGLVLATGIIVTLFIGRVNSLRGEAFAVERVNGAGVFQQVVRVNFLVFLSVSVPLYCAFQAWEFLTQFDAVAPGLPARLVVAAILYSHCYASLSFYIRHRTLGY